MQTVLVLIIVGIAAIYALWRVYDAMKHGGSPCRGCKLANTCGKNKGIYNCIRKTEIEEKKKSRTDDVMKTPM